MLDSLVRVSRRAADNHYASILANARSSVPAGRIVQGAVTLPRRTATFPKPFSGRPNRCWPVRGGVTLPEGRGSLRGQVWLQALPFQQFHVLFNSLSKVLFIFRSLYLCAIGLWPIFSFRWNLPPALSCIPKQLDSSKDVHTVTATGRVRGSHPPRRSVPRDLDRRRDRTFLCRLQLGPLRARFQI